MYVIIICNKKLIDSSLFCLFINVTDPLTELESEECERERKRERQWCVCVCVYVSTCFLRVSESAAEFVFSPVFFLSLSCELYKNIKYYNYT